MLRVELDRILFSGVNAVYPGSPICPLRPGGMTDADASAFDLVGTISCAWRALVPAIMRQRNNPFD